MRKRIPIEALEIWWKGAGYRPSPEQRRIHSALLEHSEGDDGPLPTVVIVGGGEQAGKSACSAMHAFATWLDHSIGWLVGNRYEDTEKEYQYIREAGINSKVLTKFSMAEQGPWEMTFSSGLVVKTLSSDDITKIAREAPDWIIMCEPGRQTREVFDACYRRVIPRTGWLLVAGTLEAGGYARWFADLIREGQGDNAYGAKSFSLPSYSNLSIYPLGARDPKFLAARKAILDANPVGGEEEFNERFLGIPRTAQDLVFSEFSHRYHVKDYAEFEPTAEVYLAVDPGYYPSAYAVLFIQVIGDQIRVFDELYLHHMVSSEVITLVKNHYAFRGITHITMDVAAKAHAGAQESALETWRTEMGSHNITFGGQMVGIADRNARIHDKLRLSPLTRQPFLVFHPRAKSSIWEFTDGYKLRQRRSGIIGSDNPIDHDNHSVSAIGYFIVDRYGITDVKARRPDPTIRRMAYDAIGRR